MHITMLRALMSVVSQSRMPFSLKTGDAEAGQLDELPDGRAVSF